MLLEPLIRTPTTWTSVCDRFAIHLFEGHVTLAEMEQMQLIGDEERTRMVRPVRAGEQHRAASATVILAHGLLGAMQRSMLTGLMLLSPAPHPAKVFGAIPDALTWLAPHVRAVGSNALDLDELEVTLRAHTEAFRTRFAGPVESSQA